MTDREAKAVETRAIETERQFAGRRCHLLPIIRVVLETGLRKGEFCRLEVADINLSNESRFVTIRGTRIEVKPDELIVKKSKNGKPRTIPLTPEARRIAEIQMADATTKKFLFTSRRTGGMISDFKTAFRGAVRDAGLEDFRFHDLRHSFASRLNAAGADPYIIRDLLGHSTTTMSADYTHTSFERRRQAIANMSQSRGPSSRGCHRLRKNSEKARTNNSVMCAVSV